MFNEYLLENVSDVSEVESRSIVMYIHLMKFVGADKRYMSTSWVGSVWVQCDQLNDIKDTSFLKVQTNTIRMNRIYTKAKDTYEKEGNSNPKDVLDEVLKVFPTLKDLKNWDALKEFMLYHSKGDQKMISDINSKKDPRIKAR